ncbi:hypothetical protein [Domibacillus aminovorans]|uniref:Uncharacterized protein n=1 Tax=Domibacillus aminovorans TaxID=29332 RepID=A0A177L0V4_9BACI|nr:hypothetical protein [Domibacillus aminovorans]OAH58947.1 hypothetical protein AWH49_04590 [Domibacillus aminovorans]
MSTLESDEDLKSRLEAGEGIESAMVQVVEGDENVVNVDIQLSADQTMTADEVIEKYSSVIKEKYPDQKVDLIIAKDDKLLKQTTLK